MIGIIGAMDEEVSQLAEVMELTDTLECASMVFKKGKLNGKDVVIVRSGIGKVNAAVCTQILVDRFNVDCVINTGIAGSLKNEIDIAALTLPKEKADETAKHLVDLGIHAIWNFAHVDLDLMDRRVVIENVHLSDSLMQLSYNIVKNSK